MDNIFSADKTAERFKKLTEKQKIAFYYIWEQENFDVHYDEDYNSDTGHSKQEALKVINSLIDYVVKE